MRRIAARPDIRDLILDRADALLGRLGYRKLTMEDLAREVGIGKGTIYLHFPSKPELILSHVDRIADGLHARMTEIAASSAPPERRLRDMLLTRVLLRFDSVKHYSRSLNDLLSSLRTDLLARREVHFDREAEALALVLKEGRREGIFDVDDALGTAQVLVWSTNALLPFSLSARELGRRDEMERRVSRIVDVLLRGLIRRPSARRPRRSRSTPHPKPGGSR